MEYVLAIIKFYKVFIYLLYLFIIYWHGNIKGLEITSEGV